MKKICTLLLIFVCLFGGCAEQKSSLDTVRVVAAESFFVDFEVIEEMVCIDCCVCLQNDTSQSKTVQLLADFSDDYEAGLLQEAKLFASAARDSETTSFTVPPGKTVLNVVFCGSFGSNPKKQNRLLPEIQVIIKTEGSS